MKENKKARRDMEMGDEETIELRDEKSNRGRGNQEKIRKEDQKCI